MHHWRGLLLLLGRGREHRHVPLSRVRPVGTCTAYCQTTQELRITDIRTNCVGIGDLAVLERIEVLLDVHHRALLGRLRAKERVRRALWRRLRALDLRRRR